MIKALQARLNAVVKMLEIGSDEDSLASYDEAGQDAILESKLQTLLHAIHHFRPETTHFRYQVPFAMLVLSWG